MVTNKEGTVVAMEIIEDDYEKKKMLAKRPRQKGNKRDTKYISK